MRIIALTKPMRHHGTRAGYNAMIPRLRPDVVIRAMSTDVGRLSNSASRRVLRHGTKVEWYGLASLWGELRAARQTWRSPTETLVHVMYGEDLLFALPMLAARGAHLVATFHQPVERFERLVRTTASLRRLSGVIVLDEKNRDYFEAILPGRVHALRLGVDSDYWSPGGAPDEAGLRCIAVGTHLRDLELLADVARALLPEGLELDVVTGSPAVDRLPVDPKVRVHRGISDDALRALYRRAHVSILPLLGGSASNALVQALACGVPVVATDVGGLGVYADGTEAVRLVPPGDRDAHAVALRQLARGSAALRMDARRQAEKFDWQRVAEAHRRVYQTIAGGIIGFVTASEVIVGTPVPAPAPSDVVRA